MFKFIEKLKNRKQRKQQKLKQEVYNTLREIGIQTPDTGNPEHEQIQKLKTAGLIIPTMQVFNDPIVQETQFKYELELPCKFDFYINGNIKMGAFSYTSENFRYSCDLKIGRFCSISSNVLIGPDTHPVDGISTHPLFFRPEGKFRDYGWERDLNIELIKHSYNGPVTIGDDVWIGEGVRINNNVNIGDGAVIAMGSIVTKDVPPYAIVAGVPAKIIRYRKTQQPYAHEYDSWGVINNDNLAEYLK